MRKPEITGIYNEKGYKVFLGRKLMVIHGNDRDHSTAIVRANGPGRKIPVTLLRRYCETAMRLLAEKEDLKAGQPTYANTL